MSRFGAGFAADADIVRAAELAVAAAVEPLAGRSPDLGCVFVCAVDDGAATAAAERAMRMLGAGSVIGCNAPGVLGAGRAAEASTAVAVWCGVLPQVRVRAFHLEVMTTEPGMAVIGMPEREPDDAVAVLLADPWSFPIDGFVERSNDALPGLPIVGGLASGLHGRGSTRLFVDGAIVDRGAVGVVLGGPVGAGPVVSQGCRPIGPVMTVTAADGNVLLELAGVPAATKLAEILSTLDAADQALATTGLQLGVAIDDYAEQHGRGDFLVRGIVAADPDRRGLVVGDLVDVGRTVQFQLRDATAADEDLRLALQRFRDDGPVDAVEGALLFSCNGRGRHMFASADHDVAVVSKTLAVEPVAGFFAAGEIGPVGGRNHVHGLTASLLAFGSGPAAGRGTAPAPPPGATA